MADRNPSQQFGQTFSHSQQIRPPLSNQGVTNQADGHGPTFQGGPKMAGMPPVPVPGQRFQGGPPGNFMNMNPPAGQAPPPVGGNVNGFVPPASQGLAPPRPAGMNRVPGPQVSASGAPPQPAGNFHPQVSGQFVPPSSYHNSAPPFRGGPVVNGTSNVPPAGGLQQPASRPSNQFQPTPPMSQGGPVSGPPQPSIPSQSPGSNSTSSTFAGSSGAAAPVSASGSFGGHPTSVSNASGATTSKYGLASRPTELPVPYHGHAQYSHQIGATMKLTPNPTPNSSEPPSQRSSRGPSPVNEQSYDALEGQFSPGHGAMTPVRGPTSAVTGGRPPLPPSAFPQGPFPPHPGQRMPPPPRPGMPGPPGANVGPPPPSTGAATGAPLGQQQMRPYPPVSQYPGSMPPPPGAFNQPGAPVRPPGPPTGPSGHPYGQPGPPLGPPSGPPGPPSGPPGPPSGPPGPPSGPPGPPSGPPGPPSGLSGPPSGPPRPFPGPPTGPFNLGPPTSGQGSNYPQAPLTLQGMVRPPGVPPSGPVGPLSGPTGPPSGHYGQTPMGQGYPQPAMGQNAVNNMSGDFSRMGVNEMQRVINLMQEKKLIPGDGVETVQPSLFSDQKRTNCNPDVFRCTLNAIPQTSSLLNKSRLPLGILIHPFKDLSQLPVIQSSVIVRCRSCRTYINPFVTFVDQRRWKCNLCFRINELPDEFSFDPVTKTYGDPQRRPEIKSATIEFIAPSEYMLRPPQPAVYLFVLDVSFNAVETGYLRLFTQTLVEELERLPGDARTQIGFLCFDRALYFFNLSEGLSQPQMMVVPDLEDVFLPTPDNLLVNLHECRDMVVELLTQLPALFEGNHETGNALGTALQAAFKLMTSTGGRVTVMQTMLPTVGPGSLDNREGNSKAGSLNSSNLGPASDFYKKLALDCSAQQVAVDLFMLNGQYADIASISCISKYSAGCVQYYPSFHTARNPAMCDKFESDFRRYLTRKIGFESVMRIRCTRGVSIHTFHGNFFVRSTDLLSLPNINPDAGFGMQMSIEDNLTESSNVCFQAALLYTSSKGERRIRVHTLCVPITNQLSDVFTGADQQAIAVLLAKMAADRTISSSLEDARDAMMNACQDMMNAYATQIPASQRVGALVVLSSLRLIPLFTLSMLKSLAFRLSSNIKIDDRVFAHLMAKTMPINFLMQTYYPHLYPVHALNDEEVIEHNGEKIPKVARLQLSSANMDRHGVYVMDQGENMYLMVGGSVSDSFCQEVLDVPNFMSIPEGMVDLPDLDNPTSERLRCFISHLMDTRPGGVNFLVIREDSKQRHLFFQHMVEDRTEASMSYYEFLQYLQQKIKG